MPCGARGIDIISHALEVRISHSKVEYIAFCEAKHIADTKNLSVRRGIQAMNGKTIRELAIELTVAVSEICDSIDGKAVIKNQLLRSCSSVGANVHEAKYAQSDADFINKLEIALKECYETEYWLEVLFRVHMLSDKQYKELISKSGVIRRKIIASVTTVKNRMKDGKENENDE